jgi:hypothetical protein
MNLRGAIVFCLVVGLFVLAQTTINTNQIRDGAVTLPKTGGVAQNRIAGRTTAGTGPLEALTAAQTKTLLSIAASDVSGLAATATSTSATNLTGTLNAAQMPAHTGDVTSSAGSVALSIANNAVVTADINNGAVTAAKLSPAVGSDGQVLKLAGGALSWAADDTGGGGSSNFMGPDYPISAHILLLSSFETELAATENNSRVIVCPNTAINILRLPPSPATGDTVVVYRPFCAANSGQSITVESATAVTVTTMASNNTLRIVRWGGSSWSVVATDNSIEVNQSQLAGLASGTRRVFCLDCFSTDGPGTVVVRAGNRWVDERWRVDVSTDRSTWWLSWNRAPKPSLETGNKRLVGCDQRFWHVANVYQCGVQATSGAGAANTPMTTSTSYDVVGGWACTTGTTATGRCGLYGNSSAATVMRVPSLLYLRVEGVRMDTVCTAGVQPCTVRFGLNSAGPGAADATGTAVMAKMDISVSSGRWQLVNANSATSSNQVATNNVTITNAPQTIEVVLDSTLATPQTQLYVSGQLEATLTSNVPTATNTARLGIFIEILKTGGTTGVVLQIGRLTYSSWFGQVAG